MDNKQRLFTPEGGFVAELELPPFQTPPEVLIWGARVFVRVDSYELVDFEPVPGIGVEGCYIEAFGYFVPETTPHSTLAGGLEREPPRQMVGDDPAIMVGEPIHAPDIGERVAERLKDPQPGDNICPACGTVGGAHKPGCNVGNAAPDHYEERRRRVL